MASILLKYFSTEIYVKFMLKSQCCCSKIIVFQGSKKCMCLYLLQSSILVWIAETNKQLNAGIYPIWN